MPGYDPFFLKEKGPFPHIKYTAVFINGLYIVITSIEIRHQTIQRVFCFFYQNIF